MEKHRIAILVGSLRRGSINRKIANSICALTSNMLSCYVVEIARLPLYNQDDENTPSSEVIAFRRQISEADGVLFCTPEYNRGIPGVLKNAIDVGSRPYGQSVWDKNRAQLSPLRRAELAASAPTISFVKFAFF